MAHDKLTSSNIGNDPVAKALRTINGMASVSFHSPSLVSPASWPILSTRAYIPVLNTAFRIICSATILLRPYPVFAAWLRSSSTASGTIPGRGMPLTAALELQKKNLGGFLSIVRRLRFSRLCTPRMCCGSKEEMPRLKFTAQAAWMTWVREWRRLLREGAGMPRSGSLNSAGKAMILLCSKGESWMLRELSESLMRFVAVDGSDARTSVQTCATCSRFTSSART